MKKEEKSLILFLALGKEEEWRGWTWKGRWLCNKNSAARSKYRRREEKEFNR